MKPGTYCQECGAPLEPKHGSNAHSAECSWRLKIEEMRAARTHKAKVREFMNQLSDHPQFVSEDWEDYISIVPTMRTYK